MNNQCPNCHQRPATLHPQLGVLPCDSCQQKQDRLLKPGSLPEFTTEDIKTQRGEFMDDIEPPHYKGALNKHWVQVYGEQAALDRGFSQEEINNAKFTTDGTGIRYYNEGEHH